MREHALVVTLKEDEFGWLVSLYDLTDPDPNRLPVAEGYAKDWRKAVEKALKKIDLPKEEEDKGSCTECGGEIDWDSEGGILWEGLAFCQFHNPTEPVEEEAGE